MSLVAELQSYEIEDDYRSFGLVVENCPVCRDGRDFTLAEADDILRNAVNSIGAEYVMEHLVIEEVSHTESYRGGCMTDIFCTVNVQKVKFDAEYDRAAEYWATR